MNQISNSLNSLPQIPVSYFWVNVQYMYVCVCIDVCRRVCACACKRLHRDFSVFACLRLPALICFTTGLEPCSICFLLYYLVSSVECEMWLGICYSKCVHCTIIITSREPGCWKWRTAECQTGGLLLCIAETQAVDTFDLIIINYHRHGNYRHHLHKLHHHRHAPSY